MGREQKREGEREREWDENTHPNTHMYTPKSPHPLTFNSSAIQSSLHLVSYRLQSSDWLLRQEVNHCQLPIQTHQKLLEIMECVPAVSFVSLYSLSSGYEFALVPASVGWTNGFLEWQHTDFQSQKKKRKYSLIIINAFSLIGIQLNFRRELLYGRPNLTL